MSKIVLVYPNTGQAATDNMILPLSVLQVGTAAARRGFDVKVLDQRLTDSWADDLTHALRDSPLCVGISAMTGHQIRGGLASSAIVKRVSPETPVVWGGVHPSLLPEQTLESEFVDIVVMGDGEETFVELLDRLEKSIDLEGLPGVAYKENGRTYINERRDPPDLNSLPEFDYGLVNVEKYISAPLETTRKSLAMYTSRGCPFRCAYCYNREFAHRKWTALTPENTIKKITGLREKFNLDAIFLLDDNFFVDRGRVSDILNLLVAQDWDLKIYNANCRADMLAKFDTNFMSLLKRAGVDQILVGVESGSDRILKDIKKDITVEQVLAVNEKLKKADIVPWYNFMLGFPGEILADMRMTLWLANELLRRNRQALIHPPRILVPYPGTELYHRCAELGLAFPRNLAGWATFHQADTTLPGFSSKELAFIEKALMIMAFFNPKSRPDLSWWENSLHKTYARLLRRRIKNRFYWLMPEIRLLRHRSQQRLT